MNSLEMTWKGRGILRTGQAVCARIRSRLAAVLHRYQPNKSPASPPLSVFFSSIYSVYTSPVCPSLLKFPSLFKFPSLYLFSSVSLACSVFTLTVFSAHIFLFNALPFASLNVYWLVPPPSLFLFLQIFSPLPSIPPYFDFC